MGTRGYLLCIAVTFLVYINSIALADLPGLFSASICCSEQRPMMEPWCFCKQKLGIEDSITSWCSLYTNFSQCVESQQRSQMNLSDLYLSQVFNRTFMNRRMQYLCTDDDFRRVEDCSNQTKACQEVYIQQIESQASWTERNTCSISERLASCLWTSDTCAAKLRHLLARFSDSFTTSRCTKYFTQPVGEKCVELRKHIYPSTRGLETCMAGAKFQAECLDREMTVSEHSSDIFYNLDADRKNVRVYETFRCENLFKYGKEPCFKKGSDKTSKCFRDFEKREKMYIEKINNGEKLSSQDVCSFYYKTTDCFNTSLPDCPARANHFVALLCSAFPKSCSCPLKISQAASGSAYTVSRLQLKILSFVYVFFGFCITFGMSRAEYV